MSLLFNWPSTGGGTIHTKECAQFLQHAGYEVRHIYAVQGEWGIGRVTEPLSVPTTRLAFSPDDWNADTIRERFRAAVNQFRPDYVIVTDTWNTKPLLAEAVQEFPYFLRIGALECLCPLNNVRLLIDQSGRIGQCDSDQFRDPEGCRSCIARHRRFSGGLHQAERELAEVDRPGYVARLRTAFARSEAVLVANPAIADLVRPFASRVEVVPSGFDVRRFPPSLLEHRRGDQDRKQVFFAGLIDEPMKGFQILQTAAQRLWSVRRDFEIVATATLPARQNEFTRFIGWQSQAQLPVKMSEAEIVVFPTVAQEALGRSAVEAMGCGRPVIASRIGGLPYVVDDGRTGLLVEPGNAEELAAAISRLLDNEPLRTQMGQAGRQKFEEHFTWEVILDRHYQRLLRIPNVQQADRRTGLQPS